MMGEERDDSLRFVTELLAEGRLRARGKVSLREQQVRHRLNSWQPRGELLRRQPIELDRPGSQLTTRSLETLVDIVLCREQTLRDLSHTETAEHLQGEHDLRFNGQGLVAANEEHAQQVVLDLSTEVNSPGTHAVVQCVAAPAVELAMPPALL